MGRKAYTPPEQVSQPTKRARRGVAQYALLTMNSLLSLTCFAGAAGLVFGQSLINNLSKSATIVVPEAASTTTQPGTISTAFAPATQTTIPGVTTTTEPFPDADPNAKNFLITGADNGGCATPGSQNPTGERGNLGPERSDSIMVIRIDPPTGRAAVLSFPRDLWVRIDGSNSKQRINTAYRAGEPQKLINTIYNNFGIRIDHALEIDFCAFKTLVDSVGEVTVPFDYPIRDPRVGLLIETTGCHNFDGDSALAYVRSRHLQRLNPDTGKWQEDPASDFGRISRQQDFLRRALGKVLSKGAFNLDVARGLIEISRESVVMDKDLTPGKLLEFAGVMKNLDPQTVQTYQIEGSGKMISGNSVLEPRVNGENMRAILSIFKGEAQLAAAPEQIFRPDETTVPPTSTTSPPTASTTPGSTTTTVPAPTTTLPVVNVTEIVNGFVPQEGVTCP